MDKKLFQLDFFGGPEDGLRVRASDVPGGNVLLPTDCASSRGQKAGGALVTDRALYKLAVGSYGLDADEIPIVNLRYEFVELRSPGRTSWVRPFVARLSAALGLRGSHGPGLSLGQRFKSWMMAPIDYPFRISPSSSTAPDRDLHCDTTS